MEEIRKKERHLSFGKVFLASLLAVVAGSVLSGLFWLGLFSSLSSLMQAEVVAVPEKAVLRIDLRENLVDAPSRNPMSQFNFATMSMGGQLTLYDALRAIEAAAADDRISGIYINLSGMGTAEIAAIEELRQAILDFKAASGKFVVAYNSIYTQWGYYLATAADRIYIEPEGSFEWAGLSMSTLFFKGLIDKLGVEMTILRPTACKYKSAVEPYILPKMSDANREQMQELVNSMWNTIAGSVAEARGIDLETLNRITDKLEVSLPEDALEHGFVDSLLYEDQMNDVFAELGVQSDSDGQYNFVTLGEYASQVSADLKNISADQVAIVYADGAIVDGEGFGREIYGNTLAATLAGVRADEKVKAVVLRVNSPGGSALASDVIWREMELLKAEKPVIVSMGSYAASGGYYISCPADVIVADKLTLTGSIGVFGMYLNTIDALKNKLGITFDAVKSNTSAGMGMTSPLTPAERASIMRGVDKVYTTFTNLVAQGRNLPVEKVLNIAGGRVWSGDNALGIGLIDTYGGLKTAIAIAADKAGLGDNFRVTEVIEQPTGFAAFISSLNVGIREAMTRSELGVMMKEYKQVQEATSQQGIVMYYPFKLELR